MAKRRSQQMKLELENKHGYWLFEECDEHIFGTITFNKHDGKLISFKVHKNATRSYEIGLLIPIISIADRGKGQKRWRLQIAANNAFKSAIGIPKNKTLTFGTVSTAQDDENFANDVKHIKDSWIVCCIRMLWINEVQSHDDRPFTITYTQYLDELQNIYQKNVNE